MISIAPDSFAFLALCEIVAHPGEYADRTVYVPGCRTVIAAPPPVVGKRPPSRWVERLREMGLIAPAAVRAAAHITTAHVDRWAANVSHRAAPTVLRRLLAAGAEGAALRDLAEGNPSGALEETMQYLYVHGYATPPAALWATEKGREHVRGTP